MTTSQHIPRVITQFRGAWSFLANPYAYQVIVGGITYPTAEHAFHAQKTTNIGLRHQIARIPSWQAAKRFGRALPLRDGWSEYHRYTAMTDILRNKFTGGLAVPLIHTGDAYLIEGNQWHDNTWGVCYCGKCTNGHNLLGWMLMHLRDQLNTGRSVRR